MTCKILNCHCNKISKSDNYGHIKMESDYYHFYFQILGNNASWSILESGNFRVVLTKVAHPERNFLVLLFEEQLKSLKNFGIGEAKMLLGHKGDIFPFYVCMILFFYFFLINRGGRIVVGTF